jgi:hypothetical protein
MGLGCCDAVAVAATARGSWVFKRVSTCSIQVVSVSTSRTEPGEHVRRWEPTQTLLQRLDITSLGSALPPLFIIGAHMSQAGTGATAGSHAIALKLSFPAYHAG